MRHPLATFSDCSPPSALRCCLLARRAHAERVKDLAQVAGVRGNQLVGYGLVVGLDGTGDQTSQTPFTIQSIKNMLDQLRRHHSAGVNPQLKNVAAVTVHADLPAFAKPGQTIDITVSSIGNAGSLRGGSLLMTPLRGVDGQVYAIAQGSLVVSGFGVSGKDGSRISVNVPNGGRIPNGATVERAVARLRADTVRRAEPARAGLHHRRAPGRGHQQRSAPATRRRSTASRSGRRAGGSNQRIAYLSQLEAIDIKPGDAPARVIVNSRTGTVVIGSRVRVMPAAVAHGSLSVTITERARVSQPNAFSRGETVVAPRISVEVSSSRRPHVPVQRRRQSRRHRARREPGGRRAGRPRRDPRSAQGSRRAARRADRHLAS